MAPAKAYGRIPWPITEDYAAALEDDGRIMYRRYAVHADRDSRRVWLTPIKRGARKPPAQAGLVGKYGRGASPARILDDLHGYMTAENAESVHVG